MAERFVEEFTCIECGRMVVRYHATWLEHLCVECVYMPGWSRDPNIARIIDPEYCENGSHYGGAEFG